MRAFAVMRQFILSNVSQSKEIEELRHRVKLLEEYSEETMKAINDVSEDTWSGIDGIIHCPFRT